MNGIIRIVLFGIGVVISVPSAAWRIGLDFNGGTVGAKAQGAGGFSDAAGGTYYTRDQSYEGGQAVEMNVSSGCECFGVWGGIIKHPMNLAKGDQVWLRIRTFMPVGFNWDANPHLKFLRVHTISPSRSNEGYNDWYINPKGTSSNYSHKFIFEGGGQGWDYFADKSQFPVLGRWETYEMYLKLDNVPVSSGGQARIRVWKNGVLLKDIVNLKTLKSETSLSDRTYIFTYWNGGAPQTQKMYVDDVVLTNEVPSARDAQGNPYVGMGEVGAPTPVTVVAPAPPVLEVE